VDLFSLICLRHDEGFFHLSYSIACFCLLSWTGHWLRTTETKVDEELGKEGESCSSPIVSFLSLLSDSQGPLVKNIESIGNLNGMWLRIGAASLLDFFSHLILSL
jgi:hypothetical protein